MTEIDDERAAKALEALGGWYCQNCATEMRDATYCDECAYLYCPYCGCPSTDNCDHLLALWGVDWGFSPSPFRGMEIPRLPERTDGSWPEAWPEDDLRSAFGNLLPLLDAYERDGYDAEPDEYGQYLLWSEVRAMLSEQPDSRNRFVPDSPMSCPYEDAFFEDPDTARAEIADIVERLGTGFERLAALAAMGSSRP
ncbi:MAG: hypothetical protein IT305_15405 [Chloroflexi bacterium]|nr:hypothetical protein [Chloroflexota bacterium]